jgi:transposase-like protein
VETLDLPNTNRFVCNQCNKAFQSQSDLNRHRSSVHDKSSPYHCYVQGCRRRQRGFSRKDNYESHLRHVHRKLPKDTNQVKRRGDNIVSQMDPTRETRAEFGLEGYSREDLIEMLMDEREKCRMEQRRRQEVEEELRNLRQRHEEREDMWLEFLMAKEGSN